MRKEFENIPLNVVKWISEVRFTSNKSIPIITRQLRFPNHVPYELRVGECLVFDGVSRFNIRARVYTRNSLWFIAREVVICNGKVVGFMTELGDCVIEKWVLKSRVKKHVNKIFIEPSKNRRVCVFRRKRRLAKLHIVHKAFPHVFDNSIIETNFNTMEEKKKYMKELEKGFCEILNVEQQSDIPIIKSRIEMNSSHITAAPSLATPTNYNFEVVADVEVQNANTTIEVVTDQDELQEIMREFEEVPLRERLNPENVQH